MERDWSMRRLGKVPFHIFEMLARYSHSTAGCILGFLTPTNLDKQPQAKPPSLSTGM